MNFLDGDLLDLAEKGEFDVIVQGCNCKCTFGSGLARQIKERFYPAYMADLETKSLDDKKLGTYSKAKFCLKKGLSFYIVNAYTQYDFGQDNKDRFNYDAFRKICIQLKDEFHGSRFGFPKIGAGLAGGNWERIFNIIKEELEGENITIVSL